MFLDCDRNDDGFVRQSFSQKFSLFLTSAIVSYLVVTETLSIVENLSEAGAGGLERLADIIYVWVMYHSLFIAI